MRVFLGITGASGAPYAARLLRALSESGTDVGISISDAGFEVLEPRPLRSRRDGD